MSEREQASSTELSIMFEQPSQSQQILSLGEQVVQVEKPKIMQKKQNSAQKPPPSTTNSEGISNLIGLIMIIVSILVILVILII